jgi:predicted  nucleic acid-binding Zn-ribbon protein
MNRLLLLLVTVSGAGILGACGGGQVVVQAENTATAAENSGGAVALENLTIRLLPYDRDAIFDSLQAAYPEPEPQIPDSLLKLQEAISQAQQEWKAAESRWSEVRDSLQKIAKTLEGMSRAQSQYVVLYRDFQELEPQEQQLKRQMDAAFSRFDQLQKSFVAQAEETRMRQEAWADQAFADVDLVILAKLKELKRPELADTTDATGIARFDKVKPGKWWVVARYPLPYRELYWNVPVEVKRGEPVRIKLTPENAEVRRTL